MLNLTKSIEKLELQNNYLLKTHNRYLRTIANILNEKLGVELSLKFWNILLGAWLLKTLATIYSKYDTATDKHQSNYSNSTIRPELSLKIPPFWSIVAHERYESTPEWNNYITQYTIFLMEQCRLTRTPFWAQQLLKNHTWVHPQKYSKKSFPRFSRCYYLFRIFMKGHGKTISISNDFYHFLNVDQRTLFINGLRACKDIFIFEESKFHEKLLIQPNPGLRSEMLHAFLTNLDSPSHFDYVSSIFVFTSLPTHFLETFTALHSIYLKLARLAPLKKFFVFNDLFHCVETNFFAAVQKELHGTMLYEIQHGGDGFSKMHLLRLWSYQITDKYITGGLATTLPKQDFPFYFLKGVNIQKCFTKKNEDKKKHGLYLTNAVFFNRNYNFFLSPNVIAPSLYLEEAKNFIDTFLKKDTHTL